MAWRGRGQHGSRPFHGRLLAEGGNPEPDLAAWILVGLPALVVAGCVIAFAGREETPRRASLLACAAGLCFALLALVLQSLDGLFALGPVVAFTSWQPYALAVLGLAGFTVAQSAYQAAPLAVSLPIIDSVEPTCAVVFSVLAFHQSLSLDPTSLALESFGALVALLGIFLLGRSPLVLCIYERQQAQKDHAEETAAAE